PGSNSRINPRINPFSLKHNTKNLLPFNHSSSLISNSFIKSFRLHLHYITHHSILHFWIRFDPLHGVAAAPSQVFTPTNSCSSIFFYQVGYSCFYFLF
ncbi:hypothetical protein VIGAN_01054700, partial [Vigna angularis var. angularis]